jgi:hypothetical protein
LSFSFRPIVPQPSIAERVDQARKLFEQSEFLRDRPVREAQGSPEDQGAGAPFLLVHFLWASKENEPRLYKPGVLTDRTYPGPFMNGNLV